MGLDVLDFIKERGGDPEKIRVRTTTAPRRPSPCVAVLCVKLLTFLAFL